MGEVLSFGERLRAHREERGISQAQAARELDVARTAYRLWEMEAAKPAPDRWRLISRWLGVSVATMLLAEELIDAEEAGSAEVVSDRLRERGLDWDAEAARQRGTYFDQERSLIDREAAAGNVTDVEAGEMRAVIARLDRGASSAHTMRSRPASFMKELPRSIDAPGVARQAMRATAAGIPTETLDDALLLVNELVTNAVQHPPRSIESLFLTITVAPEVLRASVADEGVGRVRPRAPGPDGGWGLALVADIASRWGAGRNGDLNVVWFELDLPRPGGS